MVSIHHPTSGTRGPTGDSGLPLVKKSRLVGVDAARGLALVGMFSIHILPAWDPETYEVTLQWQLFAGRAAALFALLAGVGLAFSTGGRTAHRGRTMTADRVGLLIRAVLITVLGLLVNQVMPEDPPAYNILTYYGMFFLLAIPFLHLPARTLFILAGVTAVTAPVLMQTLRGVLPAMEVYNPTITGVLTDPGTVLSQLLFTGTYPAAPYLTYLLAGVAIGRLNLRSLHVQVRLLGAGLVLALAAWLVYWVLIMQAGGFDQLMSSTPGLSQEQIDEIIIWGPDPVLPDTSWWWLLIPGPHTCWPWPPWCTTRCPSCGSSSTQAGRRCSRWPGSAPTARAHWSWPWPGPPAPGVGSCSPPLDAKTEPGPNCSSGWVRRGGGIKNGLPQHIR